MDGCSLRETRKRSSVKIEGNRDEEKEREEVWRNERRRPSNTIKKKNCDYSSHEFDQVAKI